MHSENTNNRFDRSPWTGKTCHLAQSYKNTKSQGERINKEVIEK